MVQPRDVTRFVNLCANYGLEFDAQPDHAWMRQILSDAAISSPSERLRLLTATCLHRAAVARHNASIERPAPPPLPGWST